MTNKGAKRKQQQKSPIRKRRSLDGPMDRILKKINQGSEGGLLDFNHAAQANLCGQTDLEIICSIIREWVSTEEDLMDEDVAYINKFFLDLIDERSYDRLQVTIDVFYESVAQRTEHADDWQAMYNDVANLILFECLMVNVKKFITLPQDS